jgi:SAM-dependent methyltransferase
MILKRSLPEDFNEWNRRWNAPFGNLSRIPTLGCKCLQRINARRRGFFSLQPNNDTRRVEYPWAFLIAGLKPGMAVLEIGGGLAGFQFVLQASGLEVTNVDPGLKAEGKGWKCDQDSIAELNSTFKTSVKLIPSTLPKSKLVPSSFDRAFSISVLEHLTPSEIEDTMKEAFRLLKPGGEFVITTDLFIDIEPFTHIARNRYGGNVNIKSLVEYAPFSLKFGDVSQLNGYEEFNPQEILSRISSFYLGRGYPALVQAIVLKKK